MKKQKGFTLIELMVAMAILAILATAGLSAYSGYIKKSRDTARAEIAKNLNSSVIAYAASNSGQPPATKSAFDQYIASSKEFFPSASTIGDTLVKDPAGGKDVCLDAQGNANQPCRFDYTAYNDGSYAISYGVEHQSSMEKNFYKTTKSIPKVDTYPADTSLTGFTAQETKPKYGVYIGSAPYIGQTSSTSNGDIVNNNDGVDVVTLVGGNTPPAPVFRSVRVDESPKKADGSTCTIGSECSGGLCVLSGFRGSPKVCTTGEKPDGATCITPLECSGGGKCVMTTPKVCSSGNVGSACSSSWTMGGGAFMFTSDYITQSCQSGLVCISSQCMTKRTVGENCTSSSYCQSGLACASNVCIVPKVIGADCVLREECATGLTCTGSKCITGKVHGESCVSSSECGNYQVCVSNQCNTVMTL